VRGCLPPPVLSCGPTTDASSAASARPPAGTAPRFLAQPGRNPLPPLPLPPLPSVTPPPPSGMRRSWLGRTASTAGAPPTGRLAQRSQQRSAGGPDSLGAAVAAVAFADPKVRVKRSKWLRSRARRHELLPERTGDGECEGWLVGERVRCLKRACRSVARARWRSSLSLPHSRVRRRSAQPAHARARVRRVVDLRRRGLDHRTSSALTCSSCRVRATAWIRRAVDAACRRCARERATRRGQRVPPPAIFYARARVRAPTAHKTVSEDAHVAGRREGGKAAARLRNAGWSGPPVGGACTDLHQILERRGRIPVHHPTHVRLVDSEAETARARDGVSPQATSHRPTGVVPQTACVPAETPHVRAWHHIT
jgi:hypothetical protein